MFPPIFLMLRALRVLLKHDALEIFEPLVPSRGFGQKVFTSLRWMSSNNQSGRPGERLARALVELGPSYIKAGQLLATRVDLIGEQGVYDVSALQDRLPGFDFSQVEAAFKRSLESDISSLFQDFDPAPISAASVAQVHFATTNEGREVAVKVLRPGIAKAFERDLKLFRWLAQASEWLGATRSLNARGLLSVYERQIKSETDLRLEAAGMETFAAYNQGDDRVVIPRADWERSGKEVLTMTRLSGVSMNDREGLIAAGHDLEKVFGQAAELLFLSIFRDGYFHGDQHGGNLSITDAGQVALVDYGIMGAISWDLRLFLADLLLSLLQRDYRAIAQRFYDEGYLEKVEDLESFQLSLRAVNEPIIDQPLHKVSFGKLVGQLLSMSKDFNFVVQPELFILQKNMIMAEGIARRVAPEINIWVLAQPLIEAWMVENRGPVGRLRQEFDRFAKTMGRLPGLVDKLDKQLDRQLAPKSDHRLVVGLGIGVLATLAVVWLV